MAKPLIERDKITIFTGSGISAESGIPTFRGADGFWNNTNPAQTASSERWDSDPAAIYELYDGLEKTIRAAEPNLAHRSLVELEKYFKVVVITQNVDDLHERAGSSEVIHMHGYINEVISMSTGQIYSYTEDTLDIANHWGDKSDFRPNLVLFGEDVQNYEEAQMHKLTSGKVLVIGTSLQVQPAATLVSKTRYHAEKILVTLDYLKAPFGFRIVTGMATEIVPTIVERWLASHGLSPRNIEY